MARATARAIVPLGLLVVGACAPTPSPTQQASSSTPSDGISVPTGQLDPVTQCAVDHGFRVVKVKSPQFQGGTPSYVLESDYSTEEGMAILTECRKLAPYQAKTDEELRVIYDRWVGERECLIELGYRPDQPPSFEKFVADWRTPHGPWDPLTGVDTRSWTDTEYAEAKKRCILEMFDRG